MTLGDLELFTSANLQGRRIKEARVKKKKQERERMRQAVREERRKARKKEKAERKELRRRKKARAAELAAKAVALEAVDEAEAPPGGKNSQALAGGDAGSASAVSAVSSGTTDSKESLTKIEAEAAESAADAEFERAADEQDRAYEEEEMRKENEADAYEDIAYENDLSLSPLFKNLHLEVVRELLDHYCGQGDVQMCSTIALVLGQLVTDLFGEPRVQQWHCAYVDQLMQLRLPVVAATVMVRAGGRIARKNQQSTTIYTACRQCGNASVSPAEAQSRCNKCKRYAKCVLCEMPVTGPFVWRSACGHGGHLSCLEAWRKARWGGGHVACPAGCPEF